MYSVHIYSARVVSLCVSMYTTPVGYMSARTKETHVSRPRQWSEYRPGARPGCFRPIFKGAEVVELKGLEEEVRRGVGKNKNEDASAV